VKELDSLPDGVFRKIDEKICLLEKGELLPDIKKLVGSTNIYRLRVGDYRIVYEMDQKAGEIVIIRVAHRKDVYR
jgi:mRNA interferase RelE/StbE